MEMPSSPAASEILYVVRLFSFTSLRYWVPGYFGTGISKGNQFRYQDSDAKAPEDPCRSAYTIVGCGTVAADEDVATPFAPYLAIRGPAARIAEAPGPVAQSGERRPRMAEVRGSSPLGSTLRTLCLCGKRRIGSNCFKRLLVL
jgi:hypothetical protein